MESKAGFIRKVFSWLIWQFPIWDDEISKNKHATSYLHLLPVVPQKPEDQIEAKFTFEPLGFGSVPRYVVLYGAIHASPTKIEAVQNESWFPGMVVEIFDHPNWRQKYDWKKVQICIFFADVSDDGWCLVNRHFQNQKALLICWRPLSKCDIQPYAFCFTWKNIKKWRSHKMQQGAPL